MAGESPDPKMDTDAEEGEGSLRTSAEVPISAKTHSGGVVCVGRALGEAIAGGFIGSVFGYGMGLAVYRHGFKGSFADAASSAKTFSILSGVHSIVVCYLKNVRGKDDELNAGIAGCLTGLALSFPGAPPAMLQSCATFGAFAWIFEKYNRHTAALALPLSSRLAQNATLRSSASETVLQPFTLALPRHMVEGFSSFYQSLDDKPKRVPRRA